MKERDEARKLFFQMAERLGERIRKIFRMLTPQEMLELLAKTGSASEIAVLEAWHQTGVGAFNESFMKMARFMTLAAFIDVLENERSLSHEAITDLILQLDREKAAWVFEILPEVLGSE